MSVSTTPWRHLSTTESFSTAGGMKWWRTGWKAAHTNKLYNILFVSPPWLLALWFLISWQHESSQSTNPFPRLGPAEDWKQFLLYMLSPGKHGPSGETKRKQRCLRQRGPMKATPASFRAGFQGGFINSNTTATSERRNLQPESSLQAISWLLPLGPSCLFAHKRQTDSCCAQAPAPLRGIKMTPLRIASNSIPRTQHLVKSQEPKFFLKQKEGKVAK